MSAGFVDRQDAAKEGAVMFDSMMTLSLTIAAIGAGLMAGVYFAFSGFIMCSLDQLGATQATNAMNAINEVILHSWFMVLFFGSTLLYTILSANAVLDEDLAGRWLLFATGLIYVFGMFLCTVMFNLKSSVESRKSTQALGAPDKTKKDLITNQVTTIFFVSPVTPMSYMSFSRSTEVFRIMQIW